MNLYVYPLFFYERYFLPNLRILVQPIKIPPSSAFGCFQGPIHAAAGRLRSVAQATVHSITAAMEHLAAAVRDVLAPPPAPQKYFAKGVQAVQMHASTYAQVCVCLCVCHLVLMTASVSFD